MTCVDGAHDGEGLGLGVAVGDGVTPGEGLGDGLGVGVAPPHAPSVTATLSTFTPVAATELSEAILHLNCTACPLAAAGRLTTVSM